MVMVALWAGTSSCNNDDDDNTPAAPTNTVQVTASLDGKQQVPANPSTATGTMTGTYDKTTRVLTYTVTYQGITPTMGHFHQGAPGVNGNPIVTFPNVTTSPISSTATLDPADGASLLNGGLYVNLHTQAYPKGEIRGNVTVK
ncbi:CHRD domain-containing protein [Hymenobacter weizhouensis]|uniref:CHRD domain-containing protein n=1 Tax=Hymenobacter sp. YIM 151500-1 TaxID=2987689 RepID=UPI0022267C60|nr:CHRD domain-containing protein [Hymenobacter sp. YIM 151500-1]UYZ62131.1 CHRD domain-containing protein [Hymenobacter sp. YIM 151500-1]